MGSKKKKNNDKKSKNSYKIKKKRKQDLKYQTRRDLLLSGYDDFLLDMWFKGDQEKINEFGDFLIEQENALAESSYDDLTSDNSYYEEKYERLMNKKCKNMDEINANLVEMAKVKRKILNGESYKKMYKKKDLGIATYLNSKRYKKRILNSTKYRKELSKIAKSEKRELKEMRKLGYIKSKDPDKELDKILKANKMMSHALSDSYIQKHFL